MAAVSEHDLMCPICQEIFKKPVILSCSHSFCRACLKRWWLGKPLKDCPFCKRRSSREDPPLNLALRNLCEAFVESSVEPVCREHSEKLRLYCVDDQQAVCLVCRDSKSHRKHSFHPIKEVTPGFRDQLRILLRPLEEHLKVLTKSKAKFSAAAAHVEAQARLTVTQIQTQFQKLHQFLQKEEQDRIRAVREEEEQKKKSLKDKITAVSREIQALSENIAATEEQLRASDVSFLLQYRAAAVRVQCCPLVEEPQLGPGTLIDQAKHLGNLSFNIWSKMKKKVQFYPVVLDPNTAHPELILSEDLSTVTFGDRLQLPENPERFTTYRVLGSEGFSSGTHSWDVEVSGEDYWAVGVMNESFQRKGPVSSGLWEIYFFDGKYGAFCPPKRDKPLSVKTLQKVRVKLDIDKRTVSFYDADTKTHLHTFTRTFTEKVFPCFRNINNVPLKISPENLSVRRE